VRQPTNRSSFLEICNDQEFSYNVIHLDECITMIKSSDLINQYIERLRLFDQAP
jgi:hypothetical protein